MRSWRDVSAVQVSTPCTMCPSKKKKKKKKLTFSVDEQNDILPKCLVIVPLHRKHLDYLIRQKARPFINGIMRRNHELFVQHQLFC